MNKIKLFFPVLLFSLLFSISFVAFATSGDGCDGCKRTAVLKRVTGGLDLNSFRSRLAERATNPCFHLQSFGGEKPPEYYFTASYETNLKGRIKSRLSISLYFEDGELIHNWKTESDRPTVTFHWHLRNMFITPSALFRKWVPLEITLLNDFEKRPEKCDINPDKEELSPGQETQVKISNIVDLEGRKSREFNRIVVQAVKGEIVGGTAIVSDSDLKAFQVGKDDITFTYIAPDEENSQATEDKIIVYNSCDILRKDEYPMAKTELKDKIAEKKIELVHYEGQLEMTYTASGGCTEGSATVLVNFGKEDNSFLSGPDQMSVYCPVESINIVEAKAINNCAENPPQIGQAFHPYYEIPLPAGEKLHLLLFKNTVSGKITHLIVNSCGPCMVLEYICSDGSKGFLGPIITDDDYKVTGGDGINNASGGQGMIHWKLHLRK